MRSKETIFLLGAEYGYRVILAVLGLLTAKFLKVEEFGNFVSALALAQIVSIAVEAGMGHFVAKELARDPIFLSKRLGQTLSWRILASVLGFVAIPLVGFFALTSGEARVLSFWLTPGVLLLGTVDFLAWILKGGTYSLKAAFVLLMTRVMLFAFVLCALFSPWKLTFLVVSYSLAGLFGVGLAWRYIVKVYPLLKPESITTSFVKETCPVIYKMGIFLVGTVAFIRVDLILVHNFLGEEKAAYYGCAARIFDVLSFIPAAIHAVFMPHLSSLSEDRVKLRKRFFQTFFSVIFFAVILAGLVRALAPYLIPFLFGPAYKASLPLLTPLLFSMIFSFPNSIFYSLFFVWNDFKSMGWAIFFGLTSLVLFNVFFLTSWGPASASWSRFLGEGLIFSYMSVCLWRHRHRLYSKQDPKEVQQHAI